MDSLKTVEKPARSQNIKKKGEEKGAVILRRKRGRKSRTGAIVLLALSVALLVISYRFPNVLAEVDSVVAFGAAIVLIYKDTTQSVQLRVVDRILDSSQSEVTRLADLLKLSHSRAIHVLKGEKVAEVILELKPDIDIVVELVPPGRALAALYFREMARESPTLEDLANSMQSVFSESLGLSLSSSMQVNPDSATVKILQPVLKIPCSQSDGPEDSLVSPVSSLLAVLICYVSKRSVWIEKCSQVENVTTIEYHMEPPPEE